MMTDDNYNCYLRSIQINPHSLEIILVTTGTVFEKFINDCVFLSI